MCGLLGEFGHQIDVQTFNRILNRSKRRGPDDQHTVRNQLARFGFNRLAILDLTIAGRQPMTSSNGEWVIVFNGEIYNHLELRKQLDYSWKGHSDTETILAALQTWGFKETITKLNGMFALAVYHEPSRKLFLARDHAGIKPLYYMIKKDSFVFASQYDQILAHPASRDLSINPEALALYLRLGYIPAPYGILKNTYMLEPGTWLEVDANGKIKKGRFFEFPVYCEPTLKGHEAYEAVDEVLTRAVERHLISDVPVGTFLSGGIDSPLITAKVREINNEKIKAFTIGTNGDKFDESHDAVKYAEEIGIEHFVEHISPNDAYKMLDDVIQACGEPFGDYSIFPTMLVSKMARRHVKVMLSGDGGDELFWGYVGRFGSILRVCEDFQKPCYWRKFKNGLKKISGVPYEKRKHLNWPSIGEWYRHRHTHFPEAWLKRIFPEIPPWPESFINFEYNGWNKDQTAQWLRWNEFTEHLSRVLLKVDRASMYYSLEVRVPYLDREVIEKAVQVDWQSCLDLERGIGKIPLRKILAKYVKHQTQNKRGFTVPIREWFRGPFRKVFEDHVLTRNEILGLSLDRPKLKTMYQLHLSKRMDYAWGLWILMSLALWEYKSIQFENK